MANFFHRLGNALVAFRSPRIIKNAATPFGTGSNGMSTNATFMPLNRLNSMLPYEHRSAMATSRFLDNNLALAGALNDNSIRFALGSGVNSYGCTGDPDYDANADRFYNGLIESIEFDVEGEQSFYEMLPVLGRGMLVDGDSVGGMILERDDQGRPVSDPQLQLFSADMIGNGDGKNLLPGETMQQGIGRTSAGRAIRCRVLKDTAAITPGSRPYWDYGRGSFIQIIDRKRVRQNRGIPWCHRATKGAMSMLDLQALAEISEYVNAVFAAIVTTPTGETPEALEAYITGSMGLVSGQTPNGTPEKKAVHKKFIEIFGGGKIPVFPEGTKLQSYQGSRDPKIFSGHMTYLAMQLGLSYGIAPSFVWPLAMDKPDTRKELAQVSWYFNFILLIMIRRAIKPVRDWILLYGLLTGKLNNGRFPRNGADYRLCTHHGPRDITIDERYYHKTWLDRLAAGKGTEEEYFSLQGQNGDTQALKRIAEIKRRKKWCVDAGVLYHGEFIQTAPGTQIGNPNDPHADPALQEQQQQQMDAAA